MLLSSSYYKKVLEERKAKKDTSIRQYFRALTLDHLQLPFHQIKRRDELLQWL